MKYAAAFDRFFHYMSDLRFVLALQEFPHIRDNPLRLVQCIMQLKFIFILNTNL